MMPSVAAKIEKVLDKLVTSACDHLNSKGYVVVQNEEGLRVALKRVVADALAEIQKAVNEGAGDHSVISQEAG